MTQLEITYLEKRTEAIQLVEKLQHQLNLHLEKFKEEKTNYGFLADMCAIVSELQILTNTKS